MALIFVKLLVWRWGGIGVAGRTCVGSYEAGYVGEDTDGDGDIAFSCLTEEGAFEVCLSVGMVNWRDAPK